MWKQRGFLNHQNYININTWKKRGFFTSKKLRQKKVHVKYMETTWNFRSAKLHQKSTWK